MSIPLLTECTKEIQRLAIAGSALARDDYRLKRLIEPLEQLGKGAAVFGKVAQAVRELIEAQETESAEKLLNLAKLLTAISYTQGETSIKGELTPLVAGNCPLKTGAYGARLLKPVLEALQTTGSGRLEIIKNAQQQGLFQDLRLFLPALQALDDPYSEIADLLAREIVPLYGPFILPQLCQSLDLQSGKGNPRRLQVIAKLQGEAIWDLLLEALESKNSDMRCAAIECLSPFPQAVPLLIKQAKGRNEEVSHAALRALQQWDTEEVVETYMQILNGKNPGKAVSAVEDVQGPRFVARLVQEADKILHALLARISKPDPALVNCFWCMLSCLRNKKDSVSEAFLLQCLGEGERLLRLKMVEKAYIDGAGIVGKTAELLLQMGTPAALSALVDCREKFGGKLLEDSFQAALLSRDPAFVYDQYAPYLKLGSKTTAHKTMEEVIRWSDFQESRLPWDPRWLDDFIAKDELDYVCILAAPGHARCAEYLFKKAARLEKKTAEDILTGLVQCSHPQALDKLFEGIRLSLKWGDYERMCIMDVVTKLPMSFLPQVEEFAKTLPEEAQSELLRVIECWQKRDQKPKED